MTIYVDEYFLLNVLMDLFVLWLTGRLAGKKYSWLRLSGAAIIGGTYAVCVLLPDFSFLGSWWGKLGCSLVMLLFAYPKLNEYVLAKLLAYLYSISFLVGGMATAIMYSFGQNAIQTWNGVALLAVDFHYLWLLLAVAFVGILSNLLYKNLARDLQQREWLVQLTVGLEEREKTVTALIDTGNNLVEPLSANPVVLVEDWCLWHLLPEEIVQALQANASADELFLAGASTALSSKMRLIPYQTIGQQGILLGFKPDWLLIEDDNYRIIHHEVIVALTKQRLSLQNHYQGLAQAKLL